MVRNQTIYYYLYHYTFSLTCEINYMFGNPSWLHFGLALRDIRHKEARSQTPFVGEKSTKNQLGSHKIVKNDVGIS